MKMNKSRPGSFLIIPLLLLVLVVVTTPSLIKATNESSYRYGYIGGYLTLKTHLTQTGIQNSRMTHAVHPFLINRAMA